MKTNIFKFIFTLILINFILANFSFAQSSRKLIHDGNEKYEQKKYNEAEIDYRKSINTKENPFIGNYNLGNTYYQQGKYQDAKQQFETAAGTKSISKDQLSKAYHNLGNALLKDEKYEESLEAYKQALKLNPKDNDTRYNLAYAQSKLQQQQQQQQNSDKNQDKKDNKENKSDQNKQENKDQQKEQKEQQQQKEQQDQAKESKDKKEQQAKKDKISKEDAEKILQALNNDEKKTQKKLTVKESTRIQIEKEW